MPILLWGKESRFLSFFFPPFVFLARSHQARPLTAGHAPLPLKDNNIFDTGVVALGAMLSVNRGLTVLKLRQNHISTKGASGLAKGLEGNTTLHTLDLASHSQSKVHIGHSGLRSLAQAAHRAGNLRMLTLHAHGASEAKQSLFPSNCRVEFARARAGRYVRRRRRFFFFF